MREDCMPSTVSAICEAWSSSVSFANWRDTNATVAGAQVYYIGQALSSVDEHQTSFVVLSHGVLVRYDHCVCFGEGLPQYAYVSNRWFRGKRGPPSLTIDDGECLFLDKRLSSLEYDPFGDLIEVLEEVLRHRAALVLQRARRLREHQRRLDFVASKIFKKTNGDDGFTSSVIHYQSTDSSD